MEQLTYFFACAGVFLSVLSGLLCIALAKKLREVTHKQQVLATDVDYRFNEVRRNLDAVAQQTAAQLQRLVHPIPQTRPQPQPQPVAVAEPVVTANTGPAINSRQSVTERRHRVLTLARRGMDVKTIAQTLGIPHGEVALIIRMSNPKFGE